MSRYDDGWAAYVPVAERRRRAARAMVSTITLFDGMAITEFDVLPASASHRL
jgi:hypothetical protein